MATGLVIFIFLIGSLGPMVGEQSPRPGFFLVLMATLVAAAWALFAVLESRLEKTGRTRHIVRAERLLSVSRAAVVGMHAYGVFALGWSESARAAVGGLPVIDDLTAAAPALVALVLLYAGYAPIQKRLREAVLFRFLHEGRPIGRALTRWQLVWEHVRHSILLALVPLVLLRVWIYGGGWLWDCFTDTHGPREEWFGLGRQITGVFVVLAFAPWMLRFVWDTVPLEGGELRDRVERVLSRNRVSARNVLVWQTSSGILNGALMGVVPMARYVLFTDALLQLLPVRQVEAVAAHEAGHGRLWHLPWLLGSMMTAALLFAMAFEVLARSLEWSAAEWGLVGVGVSVLGAVLTLGFVSRRFELQADAFAVADLSRNPEPVVNETGEVSAAIASDAVTAESVAAMNAALGAVAELNGVPRERFTWRHGTIAGRQEHLEGLVGVRLEALPIDRAVRWIKRGTLLGVALAVGLIVLLSVQPS